LKYKQPLVDFMRRKNPKTTVQILYRDMKSATVQSEQWYTNTWSYRNVAHGQHCIL